VASNRPISDVIGVSFLLIGASLVSVAVRALLAANEATALVAARAAFEQWYPIWIHASSVRGSRPIDEEIAAAFAEEHRGFAATLQRFQVWPFHWAAYRDETMHVSRAR